MGNLMTAPEVAALKGVTRQGVHKAIKTGMLRAERVGGVWIIKREDAEAWTPYANMGRPKKSPPAGEG